MTRLAFFRETLSTIRTVRMLRTDQRVLIFVFLSLALSFVLTDRQLYMRKKNSNIFTFSKKWNPSDVKKICPICKNHWKMKGFLIVWVKNSVWRRLRRAKTENIDKTRLNLTKTVIVFLILAAGACGANFFYVFEKRKNKLWSQRLFIIHSLSSVVVRLLRLQFRETSGYHLL